MENSKLNDIILKIKENENEWNTQTKKEYLLEQNLKVGEIHKLYCLWFNCKKSLIKGPKSHLFYELARTMDFGRQWDIISG